MGNPADVGRHPETAAAPIAMGQLPVHTAGATSASFEDTRPVAVGHATRAIHRQLPEHTSGTTSASFEDTGPMAPRTIPTESSAVIIIMVTAGRSQDAARASAMPPAGNGAGGTA